MSEEQISQYGAKGKLFDIGGTTINIDDEFMIATLLAVISVLNAMYPSLDEKVSEVGQKIYDEITKTN